MADRIESNEPMIKPRFDPRLHQRLNRRIRREARQTSQFITGSKALETWAERRHHGKKSDQSRFHSQPILEVNRSPRGPIPSGPDVRSLCSAAFGLLRGEAGLKFALEGRLFSRRVDDQTLNAVAPLREVGCDRFANR